MQKKFMLFKKHFFEENLSKQNVFLLGKSKASTKTQKDTKAIF